MTTCLLLEQNLCIRLKPSKAKQAPTYLASSGCEDVVFKVEHEKRPDTSCRPARSCHAALPKVFPLDVLDPTFLSLCNESWAPYKDSRSMIGALWEREGARARARGYGKRATIACPAAVGYKLCRLGWIGSAMSLVAHLGRASAGALDGTLPILKLLE
eukprot:1157794-Pelagomonas_calceolata.AAC.3